MWPAVTYTPCTTSSREQTGDIITFANFEEGNIWTKSRNNAESGDEYNDESIMTMDSGDESDHGLIFTEMLEVICDKSQSHTNVIQSESRFKICDIIRQRQS